MTEVEKGMFQFHARDRATTHGRAYASPVLDYPHEGGGFQPELVFDEFIRRLVFSIRRPRPLHSVHKLFAPRRRAADSAVARQGEIDKGAGNL
jgi:hypothetical protein